jgi:putative ABC transport system permease protein
MTQLSTLITALRGIFANKLRSSLTVLGVIIGIASVIALSSVGHGSSQMIKERIGSLGSNLLAVTPGSSSTGFVRGEAGSGQTLTYEDAQAIAASSDITTIKAVAPEASTSGQLVANGTNAYARISGETPQFTEVRNQTVAEGSFITQDDVDNKGLVCVLGSSVAQELFSNSDPVGQTLQISSLHFTVVGVMKSVQGIMGSDNSVYVPITTVMYRMNPRRTPTGGHIVNTIYLEEKKSSQNTLAISQVTKLLHDRHQIALGGTDDFTITSQQDVLNTLTETSDTLTMLLTIIGAISLLVAGIGIMNIMLVSVTERTREIGIRKAVGAKRRNILMQFLLEASSISMIGGLIGIGVGIGASKLLSGTITLSTSPIKTVITADSIIMAFFVALAVGIVSGVYPAMRASRLNPIDALRYE